MEQVIHYLLQVINKKCLKSLPWPLTTPKEFAEFRNVAISIINVSIILHSNCLPIFHLVSY